MFVVKPLSLIKKNRNTDYSVNFSRQFDIGKAISIIKHSDSDKLFILPIEPLVYWQAKIGHASKLLYYYLWMENVPEFNIWVKEMFEDDPPTFVYIDPVRYKPDFEKYNYFYSQVNLNNYHKVIKDSVFTGLYASKESVIYLSTQQQNELDYYRFKVAKP